MKTSIVITLQNGVLSYEANTGVNDTIALLEAVKHKLVSQALGGVGRPPEASGEVSGGSRAPGLEIRRVDSRRPALGP